MRIVLEKLESHDAAMLLRGIEGIGPWTAAVILLRGLGRLDVFPMNDTSVAHNLALVAGSGPVDVEGVLRALSPQQGMLYYHLLLARLETQNDVGRASASAASTVRQGMTKTTFKVDEHVSWNSEAGRVSGTIVRVHTMSVEFKGYTHHASKDDPQYEIKSDKTDHVAMHKASALRRKKARGQV